MFRSACRVVLVMVSVGATAAWSADVAAPKTSPTPAPDPVLAYLTIPNLNTALEHAEAVSRSFSSSKDAAAPGFKALLGGMLGDAQLTHLVPSKAIVGIVLSTPAGMPGFAVVLPVTKDASYDKTFTGFGWKTRTADGLLFASSTPALLEGHTLPDVYARAARSAAAIHGDVRLSLAFSRIMDLYGPMLEMGLSSAMTQALATQTRAAEAKGGDEGKAASVPPAMLTHLMELEGKLMMALLKQTQSMDTDLRWEAGAMTADTTMLPKPGSALADLAAMPAPAPVNKAAALLAQGGFMNAVYELDPKAVASFAVRLLGELPSDGDAGAFAGPEMTSVLTSWGELATGQTAYAVHSSSISPFTVDLALGLRDDKKALPLIEKSLGLMGPDGSWHKALAGMGVNAAIRLDKKVRKHAGVDVHRYHFDMSMPEVPAEQLAVMQAMNRDVEFAIVGGYYVGSQEPAALDRLIDRASAHDASAGLVMRAPRVVGEGQHGYLEYDVVQAAQKALAMVPPSGKPTPNPFSGLSSGEPMMFSFGFPAGSIRFQWRFPLATFTDIAKTAKPAAIAKPSGGE
jgi:hypothetical protein